MEALGSGGTFGSNPLQQHLGLGTAHEIAQLEIFWPTSNTTQVFKNVHAGQAIVITEGQENFQQASENSRVGS